MDLRQLPRTEDAVLALFGEFGSVVSAPLGHAAHPLLHRCFVYPALLNLTIQQAFLLVIQFKELLLPPFFDNLL